MVLTGWSIPIGALVLIVVTLWVRNALSNWNLENTCTTCGTSRSENNKLVRCSNCNELFCLDGIEEMTEAKNRTASIIEVAPSEKDATYPCGTKVITTNIDLPQTTVYFCKKHSPRHPFRYRLTKNYG